MQIMNRMAAMAVVATVLTIGCGKRGDAVADSVALAMKAESAAAAMTPPTPAAPTMSDANILAMMDHTNMADSAQGAFAATKATNKEVHDFGHTMTKDHHDMREKGKELATKLGLTPALPPGDQSEAMAAASLATLESAPKGAAWDKLYIDMQVRGHEAVLANANAALTQAQSQELKDMISKAIPDIQKHLDKAMAIQKKLPI